MLNQIDDVTFSSVISFDNRTRVAYDYRVIGDILVHKGIGRNKDVVSNCHLTYDRRVNSQINAVANRRDALSMPTVFLTDSTALMDVHVTAQLRTGVNRNAVRMTNIETCANLCCWRNLETALPRKVFSRKREEEFSQSPCLTHP